MNFPNQLREELADRRLARHPFYTAWTEGALQRENLRDEEEGAHHHPELWLRFAEGLGCSRESLRASKPRPETAALVETFFEQAYDGYATGLGSLFAYEDQVPEVAELKIEALSRFYDVQDDRTLEFFRVHQSADVVHAAAVAELLEALPPAERERASGAAQAAATALWRFLDSQDEASPRSS
jgi:pyrroloquinoline-quinone synthase